MVFRIVIRYVNTVLGAKFQIIYIKKIFECKEKTARGYAAVFKKTASGAFKKIHLYILYCIKRDHAELIAFAIFSARFFSSSSFILMLNLRAKILSASTSFPPDARGHKLLGATVLNQKKNKKRSEEEEKEKKKI